MQHSKRTASFPPARGITLQWVMMLIVIVCLSGCDGCREPEPIEEAKAIDEPEVQTSLLRAMPTNDDSPISYVKSLHWSAAFQDLKATRQDYRGVINIEPMLSERGKVTREGLGSHTIFSRPAALVKGQQKRFDLQFLAPPVLEEPGRGLALVGSLITRQGSLFQDQVSRLTVMAPHQYFFVLLSSRPAEWSFLNDDDWQKMQSDELSDAQQGIHYRLIVPTVDGVIPLPDSFLQWTSIAYVMWDDLSPESLTPDQQQALLDWTHWGGRVIINGPSSAVNFRDTILEPLLPVEPTANSELSGEQLIPMVKAWHLADDVTPTHSDMEEASIEQMLRENESMPGADGQLLPEAKVVDRTNGLVVEGDCGRGNVVMTRFDLTAGWVRKWRDTSGFFNGALLRRPPRDYRVLQFGTEAVFAGDLEKQSRNPQLISGLRILSRDTALASSKAADAPSPARETRDRAPWLSDRFDPQSFGGVGAWNQKSGVASLARETLNEVAGISIPSARFVARSLLWYLAVLVPLNYIVFGMIKRLEWAWIAVPVIASVGAIWVARQAQLDIGFARSRSEVAMLELQPRHNRGHLTRFFALYNSLSTTYAFDFDTREALLTKMSSNADIASAEGDAMGFRYGFNPGVQVEGVGVASNTTRLMHAEQMIDLGGSMSLSADRSTLNNETVVSLENAIVVARDPDNGELIASPLGPLQAGESVKLDFRSVKDEIEFPGDVPAESIGLMRLLAAERSLPIGEVRLIGRIAGSLSGCEISPSASQVQAETVVHAALAYAALPAAAPDVRRRPAAEPMAEDFSSEVDSESFNADATQ
ncbi:MAG: hypothetical protein R3C05_16185 [Pirellulaceae bacterium]